MKRKIYNKDCLLMGNQFKIGLLATNFSSANNGFDIAIKEIQRIENLLTTYNPKSITCQINKNAGISPIEVPNEVIDIVERSIKISELTQGAFDITYGSLDDNYWNFNTKMSTLPNIDSMKKSVELINFKNIIIDKKNQTIFLKNKNMKIGFGGIGKGYAADKAKIILQQLGFENGVINASGDMTVWGYNDKNEPWTIGIVHPDDNTELFSNFNISNSSIATSGNYKKFVIIDNKKYSHTINPKTGMPINGIKSVTTICKYAEFADAIATPIMIFGVEKGLNLVNQINGLECVIFDDDNKVYFSKGISI